ncbi:hypothetical protein B0H19DRAFT_1058482 [Mycena capillaripes]|nr:hypothetical protein B0H19DRAFT_1058482 [Mycena capillaripes]
MSIAKLKHERKILRGHLASYIYSVLTLSNEIVSEIFFQTLDPSNSSPSGPASSLFLGHVCRKWRDIALSTPCHWTAISLTITGIAAPDSRLRLLETWFSRSRELSFARQFVDAIVPHQKRWQAPKLKISFRDLPRTQGNLPCLRANGPVDGSPRMFLEAPKLKTLSWDDSEEISITPIPPLLHLQTFCLFRLTHSNPNLQRRLLDSLTLPVLEDLEILEPLNPTVVDLITRSKCALDVLFIIIGDTKYFAHATQGSGEIELFIDETVESRSRSSEEGDSAGEKYDDNSDVTDDDSDSTGYDCDSDEWVAVATQTSTPIEVAVLRKKSDSPLRTKIIQTVLQIHGLDLGADEILLVKELCAVLDNKSYEEII